MEKQWNLCGMLVLYKGFRYDKERYRKEDGSLVQKG